MEPTDNYDQIPNHERKDTAEVALDYHEMQAIEELFLNIDPDSLVFNEVEKSFIELPKSNPEDPDEKPIYEVILEGIEALNLDNDALEALKNFYGNSNTYSISLPAEDGSLMQIGSLSVEPEGRRVLDLSNEIVPMCEWAYIDESKSGLIANPTENGKAFRVIHMGMDNQTIHEWQTYNSQYGRPRSDAEALARREAYGDQAPAPNNFTASDTLNIQRALVEGWSPSQGVRNDKAPTLMITNVDHLLDNYSGLAMTFNLNENCQIQNPDVSQIFYGNQFAGANGRDASSALISTNNGGCRVYTGQSILQACGKFEANYTTDDFQRPYLAASQG